MFILQFDTLPIEMVWFRNISSLIPLTHCRSVFFDNQICYSVTPLNTGGGEYRALLQFDRFGTHSVPPLFKLSWTT
ncbi:MAG: hypothetical protein CH6_1853 [Candidatus Kapaibacterium sp.]|nr:MAG: hypothetical protein CH6_1853 [Candidatus Kapabacteria bacterium]